MSLHSYYFLRQLHRDERGSAILLTGLAMFTMVVAAGTAIDLSRNHTLQTNVGTALDAATLAAANASINVPCEVDANNQQQLQDWVTSQGVKYFNMNIPPELLNSTSPSQNTLTFTMDTSPDYKNSSVTGYSKMQINSSFLQIAGDSSVPVATCSQVHIPLASDLGPSTTNTSPHVSGDKTTGLFTNASGSNGQGGTPKTVGIATGGTQQMIVDGNTDGTNIHPAIAIGKPTGRSGITTDVDGTVLTFGDYGSWSGGANNRQWIGHCATGQMCDLNNIGDIFEISGWTNTTSFGPPSSAGNYPRVIGLFDDVLIGTSLAINTAGTSQQAPQFSLDVNGDINSRTGHYYTTATDGALVLDAGPASTSSVAGIWLRADNTLGSGAAPYNDLMVVYANGNTTTDPYMTPNTTLDGQPVASSVPPSNSPSSQASRRVFNINSDEWVNGVLSSKTLWIGGYENPADNILAVGSANEFTATNDGQTLVIAEKGATTNSSATGIGQIQADASGIHIKAGVDLGQTGTGNVNILGALGQIWASGPMTASAFNNTSDRRLKKDIKSYSADGLALIEQLKPVTFNWKAPTDDNMGRRQIGFIAQDVQKVLPDVVSTAADKDKTLSINYNEMVPVLTKALQQQQDEIAELKKEVAELKAKQ